MIIIPGWFCWRYYFIACLCCFQKILVARVRNEIEPQTVRLKSNKHKPSPLQSQLSKSDPASEKLLNNRIIGQEIDRSVLVNKANKQDRSLLKPSYACESESISGQKNSLLKERHISVDSSSEENRTPCCSPINGNTGELVSSFLLVYHSYSLHMYKSDMR